MGLIYGEITSRKNDKVVSSLKLCDKKNRDREGLFFVEGVKLLEEVIFAGLCVTRLFFTKKALDTQQGLIASAKAEENFLVTDEVMEKLSDESSPQGIFACVKKPKEKVLSDEEIQKGGFLILQNLQNPQNIGAIFRCAFSLGMARVVLSDCCADIYGPKAQRASMGAILKSEIFVTDSAAELSKRITSFGNRVYCTHLHKDSKYLGSFEFKNSDSVIIGNEGKGVTTEAAQSSTDCLIIPMVENAESLNAATAASIILWEINKNKLLSKQ